MKMFIEDDELEGLSKPSLSTSAFIESLGKNKIGGQEGSKKLPELSKELIARDVLDRKETGLLEKDIARIHGVAQQTTSYLGLGFSTSGIDQRKPNERIMEIIAEKKVSIAQRTISKIDHLVERFNPEKLDHNEIPGAALKLSNVMQQITSDFSEKTQNGPIFVVYAPRMRDEDSYDVIDVQAEEK